VTTFLKELQAALDAAPFHGNQRALCLAAVIDPGQFHRVLNGKQAPTPRVVGLVAKVLPRRSAQGLIDCYLKEVAAEIAQAQRPRLRKAQ